MRWLLFTLLGLLLAASCASGPGSARITKVLPHLLDSSGHHTTVPSLYERDAHQAYLRTQTNEVSGLRFDVQWRCSLPVQTGLRVRVEIRGSKDPRIVTLETPVERRAWYERWTSLALTRDQYLTLGDVIAWRASVWDGDRLLTEERSFLW